MDKKKLKKLYDIRSSMHRFHSKQILTIDMVVCKHLHGKVQKLLAVGENFRIFWEFQNEKKKQFSVQNSWHIMVFQKKWYFKCSHWARR